MSGGFLSAGTTLVGFRGSVRIPEETVLRTLAVTQNITIDGSIEMLDDWFNPQRQADIDNSDLLEELHRQDSRADAFLVGRRTFEDLRRYWPEQSDDATGIAEYLNRVHKYVASSTMTDPKWQSSTVLGGAPLRAGHRAEGVAGPRHRGYRKHDPLPYADRRRTHRRVLSVCLSRRAGP
jgi:hypothetical protein